MMLISNKERMRIDFVDLMGQAWFYKKVVIIPYKVSGEHAQLQHVSQCKG